MASVIQIQKFVRRPLRRLTNFWIITLAQQFAAVLYHLDALLPR